MKRLNYECDLFSQYQEKMCKMRGLSVPKKTAKSSTADSKTVTEGRRGREPYRSGRSQSVPSRAADPSPYAQFNPRRTLCLRATPQERVKETKSDSDVSIASTNFLSVQSSTAVNSSVSDSRLVGWSGPSSPSSPLRVVPVLGRPSSFLLSNSTKNVRGRTK
ncbi:hypothetical protein AGDE_12990 [Angomonas deanei]|uniref:Uncharacterized protein n=1 Tax=Angomonas deanei TaxID=59799 RepID=A0A7G2CAZ0_9TRYP|nr:hypothetical protein AGDE_12990 [Angomonas deanei]CAD2216615.1 hypothetical protein, conserved [Angomonas deanei]|eukprot:EPY23189.1 hypothetical protein AGDE_12990 [Angomonas deanei]